MVIVPFFGTTLAMQIVGVDLSAETKHTWIVPLRAPICAGGSGRALVFQIAGAGAR